MLGLHKNQEGKYICPSRILEIILSRTKQQGFQQRFIAKMREHCTTHSFEYFLEDWNTMNMENILPEIGLAVVTKIHRLQKKLKMPSGDFKEDRLMTSAQSTPCGTPSLTPCVTPNVSPHTSPLINRRSWFNNLSPAPVIGTPELGSPNSLDMGGNAGGETGGDRWSFFGTFCPIVQKSSTDPGSETNTGFTLQSYFGVTKSNTLEGIKTQVNLMVDDPAKINPPKIDISGIECKRPPQTRPHKLKPRDMNVLTPSGF